MQGKVSSATQDAPAHADKLQAATWRFRVYSLMRAMVAFGNSASQPATRASEGCISSSNGLRHSTSLSVYTPPMRSTTMYLP